MPLFPWALLLLAPANAVDLSSQWITDGDIARIVQQHPDIDSLDLSHTKITDVGLEYLKPLKNVRELSLYYAEYITEDGLTHLRDWKHLQVLNLRGTRVTSKVFDRLVHLTGLRELDVAFTLVDDEGWEQLASLPNLEKLAIGGNRLTGSALPLLKLVPTLTYLDAGGIQRVDSGLWGLPLSQQNLERLGELKQLRGLNLSGAFLNDRGTDRPGHPDALRKELRDLSPLAKLENLEYLDLTRQPIFAESLAGLKAMPKLRELRLGMVPNVEPEGVPPMPALRTVYLNGTWIKR